MEGGLNQQGHPRETQAEHKVIPRGHFHTKMGRWGKGKDKHRKPVSGGDVDSGGYFYLPMFKSFTFYNLLSNLHGFPRGMHVLSTYNILSLPKMEKCLRYAVQWQQQYKGHVE